MSKLGMGVLVIIIVVSLAVSGVVEVTVDLSKFEGAPGRVQRVVRERVVTGEVKAWLVNAKREGELWLIKDEQKKFELALLYVRQDAEILQEMAQAGVFDQKLVIVQAGLLDKSVSRIKDVAEDVSAEVMADAKSNSRETFGLVSEVLEQAVELVEDEEALPAGLLSLKRSLANENGLFSVKAGEEELGRQDLEENAESEVAGAVDDEATAEDSSVEKSEIPLLF